MSLRDLHSTNRKKYKRAINKLVREFNKSIEKDWLWNKRFIMSQDCAFFFPYEDRSGGEYVVILKLTDTKTGKVEMDRFNNYEIDWHMYEWANKCITETWKVWDEDPNPNEQARLEGRIPR